MLVASSKAMSAQRVGEKAMVTKKEAVHITAPLCTTKYYYKVALKIDPWHIWNVIYNARCNKSRPPTSPNTAPARQNESHHWSASHMKRHLQCAEQTESPSNFTKYCACHAKWMSWLIRLTYETSFTMRRASKVTLQTHQVIAAPARQNESHHWSASHMKRHLQCAEQTEPPSNFTKYCGCHAKWMSWLIRLTYETSFAMRRATRVSQTHQVLPLPRSSEFKISARNPWIAFANIKRITRPGSDHEIVISHLPLRRPDSSHLGDAFFVSKITTFRAPAISRNCTKCCACHEKSHSNFTKYCAWQEKCTHSFLLCSLLASILSWHLFSLGIYSLLASILSWHLFSLGIYSLLASILSWHLFSLGIYSLLASILS